MRAVLQRVSRARVTVDDEITGAIDRGLVVLLGVAADDNLDDVRYLLDKTVNLRIFDDADGKMNLSVRDIDGGLLVVSQFTLFGDVRRGRRPSYIDAAPPEFANKLYEEFVAAARRELRQVETGRFQAMMNVELINDGPVTIMIDSRKLF